MCASKDAASTKIDRLIASMDRLSEALERAGLQAPIVAPDATKQLKRIVEDVVIADVQFYGPITKALRNRILA